MVEKRNINEITKDLEKLANFRKELHYSHLVEVVIGNIWKIT